MSRIDEALRKAAGTASPVLREDSQAPVVDPSILDRFSNEERQQEIAALALPQMRVGRVEPGPLKVPGQSKLVMGRDVSPATVEQYRRLAATLHELQSAHGFKTLMVSSALPREGKTLTVANLAVTLSESYARRVLLIDADLRRPTVHTVFGCPNGKGLSELLRGVEQRFPIHPLSPNLSVMTAGCAESDPTSLLTSPRLQAIIEECSSHFDWVLLDTPPVGLLADAQHIARLCYGVLFVIGAGSTPLHLIQRSITELGVERIVGTVLNRVEPQSFTKNDYYHSYYEPFHTQQTGAPNAN